MRMTVLVTAAAAALLSVGTLPGLTLQPGRHRFELADPQESHTRVLTKSGELPERVGAKSKGAATAMSTGTRRAAKRK